MLLENNQVGTGIGSGIFAESAVGQTQCRPNVGTLHKFHHDERRYCINHTLRGNKGNGTHALGQWL